MNGQEKEKFSLLEKHFEPTPPSPFQEHKFSLLDKHFGIMPEEEKKPSFLERIVPTVKDIWQKLPEAIRITPEYTKLFPPKVEKPKAAPRERPTMRAMTPVEKEIAERMPVTPIKREYPKAEELEFGKFEKWIDVPGQLLTNYANMYFWGFPGLINKMLFGEELPAPKGEVAGAAAAVGTLGGLARAGLKKVAPELVKFAPFHATAKLTSKLWKKPAKTLAGKVIQNVVKNANTLGLSLGAVEWKGENAKEILKNKLEAFASGEAIGAFFGGMQFVHFSKVHPILSFIIRYGTGSALLDFAEKKTPFDERSLFEKTFDYGLNAYFLQRGVSPKTYHNAVNDLIKETKRFNKQARAEGFNIKLPETPEEIEEVRLRVTRPETWIRPEERARAEERLTAPISKIATEKGFVFPAEIPERERIKIGYRAAEELPPEEIARETLINIKPKEDGSVDVKIKGPPAKPGAAPKAIEETEVLRDIWIGYKDIEPIDYRQLVEHAHIKFGKVRPEEVVEYLRSKGKEVINIPKIPPTVVKERKKVTFKDELLQAINEDVYKIKANRDYPISSLRKILPPQLIGSQSDPMAKPMDEAAQLLRHRFPEIDGDVALYDALFSRKKPLGKKEIETREEEHIEEEFEEFKAREEERRKRPTFREMMEPFAERAATREELETVIKEAYTDKLTGIGNAAAYAESAASEAQAVIDFDNLKKLNDVYGHENVNKLIEKAGKNVFQKYDSYRFGGDEFVIKGTRSELEGILPKVEKGLKSIGFDVSWGIGETFNAADKAMYRMKAKHKKVPPKIPTPAIAAEVKKPIVKKKEKPKELFKISPELKEIEELLRTGKLTGKELTEKQKKYLEERGAYKEEEAREPAPLPEVEVEKMPTIPGRRIDIVDVSVETPTGKVEDLGQFPAKNIDRIKSYARKLGVEGKLRVSKSQKRKWGEYIPPSEMERFMKEVLRDVKRKPKEKWEEWQKEDQKSETGLKELYAGMPPPEFARSATNWIISKLQIGPQFKKIGAEDTGNAFRRYHPIRNAYLEHGERESKKLSKFDLSPEDFQELTFIASRYGKFYPKTAAERTKFSKPYHAVRRYFDNLEAKLKELGIIVRGWPESAIQRMKEEKVHLEANWRKAKSTKRRNEIRKQIKDIDDSIYYLKRSKYVHIPRTWLEMLWEKNPKDAPMIFSQFFRERKTLDIEKFAKYLIDKGIIKPEDTDIRKIMAAYAHKVGHKIALAEIINNGLKDKVIRDADLAPDTWQTLPSRIFPTLKGKKVHPVFADFFEKNLVRMKFMPPTVGKVLGTIKLLQFYNPAFLPMYDVVQAWWTGSVRSRKTPASIRKAFMSMKNKDKHYWDMHYWGGFSTPYTPTFDTYMKRVKRIVDSNSFLKRTKKYINPYRISWDLAWAGDHFIRLITYHHYIGKGFTPKEAARLTAKAHADYASVPPATRKWLNKIFFTPSFKIAMMSAQAEMVKNAGKYLVKGQKMTGEEKEMAKMLVGLTSGIILRNIVMDALGFDTDQYGLKYFKKIQTDKGKKELVLHAASPDNVYLRFIHRFKGVIPILGKAEEKFKGFLDRAKWELHPLWQLGVELWSNKSVSFEPIYDPFVKTKDSWRIARDVLRYSTARLLRFTELIPGMTESDRRIKATNALHKEVGKFSIFLDAFTLPYIRNTREKQIMYEYRRLKRQFQYMNEMKPAKTDAEAKRRTEAFIDRLKKLEQRLKEISKNE